jgi:phage virion morphogenesis protein
MTEHDKYYIYDDKDLQALLKAVKDRIGNTKPAFEVIGEIVHTSILRNFEEGGRPKAWQDLAESTKKQRAKKNKWPGQILVMSGVRGGLMGSISYDAMPEKVVLVANKPYAAIQHFGGMAGKGRKVKIPARPYMMIQDEDWAEIKAALNDFIIEGRL